MNLRPKIPLLLLWCFAALAAHAQQPVYRHYTIKTGLPQIQVMCLAQDANKMVWVGTKNGVAFFDGEKFTSLHDLNTTTSILKKEPQKIICTNNNTVYSVMAYSPDIVVIKDYKVQPNAIKNYGVLRQYSTIHHPYLRADTLWFTLKKEAENSKNHTQTLAYLYQNTITILPRTTTQAHHVHFCISPYNAPNTALVHNHNTGFYTQNIQTQAQQFIFSYPNIVVDKILPLSKTDFLTYNHTELIYYHNNQVQIIEKTKVRALVLLKNNIIQYLRQTPTQTYQLVQRSLVDNKIIKIQNLSFDTPNCQLIDSENNVYIGTEKGLFMVFDAPFTNFVPANGLPPTTYQVLQGGDKNTYFVPSDYKMGIYQYNGLTTTQILNKNADKKIVENYYGGVVLPDGNLIIPNQYGAAGFDVKTQKFGQVCSTEAIFYAYQNPTNNDLVLCGFQGRGLFIKKNVTTLQQAYAGKWQQYRYADEANILSVTPDKHGNYWVISGKGVGVLLGDSLYKTQYDNKNQKLSGYTITTDHKGNVWTGDKENSNGLIWHDAQKYRVRTRTDIAKSLEYVNDSNYLSNPIHALKYYCNATDTVLLIGIDKGFGVMDLRKWYKNKTLDVHFFDDKNNFEGYGIEQNSIYVTQNNEIYMICPNVVIKFDYEKYTQNQQSGSMYLPKLFIKSVGYLNPDLSANVVYENAYYRPKIDTNFVFEPTQNNLKIDFVGITTTQPLQTEYSYRLNDDGVWSAWTTKTYSVFNNLDARKYTFEVKARTLQGTQTPVQQIFFEIKPFWYHTWWFYLICLLLIGLILYYFYTNIRQKEADKNRINELKFIFITSQIETHFLNNVFQSLEAMIDYLPKEKVKNFTLKISNLLNFILKNNNKPHRKFEKEYEFAQHHFEVLMQLYFDRQAECDFLQTPQNFEAHIAQVQVPVAFLQLYIENAYHHGLQNMPRNYRRIIKVTVRETDTHHHFVVEDNGTWQPNQPAIASKNTTKLGRKLIQEIIDHYNKYNKLPMVQHPLAPSQFATGAKSELSIPKNYTFIKKNKIQCLKRCF